jgi:hypothetical protein
MKVTIEQRVFIVETFARKKTYRKCIRKFHHKYPDSPVPAIGSVCDIKKQSKRIVLTEGKVWDIEARLQISPRKSLRCLAQETGVLLLFHDTVNSDRYVNDILNPFFNQLTAEERQYG